MKRGVFIWQIVVISIVLASLSSCVTNGECQGATDDRNGAASYAAGAHAEVLTFKNIAIQANRPDCASL